MNRSIKNGFCPKCGALMRENVCQSCGFSVCIDYSTNPYTDGENTYSYIPQPAKKNKTGLIIGIIVGGIAILVVIVLLLSCIGFVLGYTEVLNVPDLAFPEVEDDYYSYDDSFDDYYYDYYDEFHNEEETEAEDYFEKYGNTIVEPEMEGRQWDDIWDTPENEEE